VQASARKDGGACLELVTRVLDPLVDASLDRWMEAAEKDFRFWAT
jgi:hypothetical protein